MTTDGRFDGCSIVLDLARRIEELEQACEAVKHALQHNDLKGNVIWILPPHQAAAVHETAWQRLDSVLGGDGTPPETS